MRARILAVMILLFAVLPALTQAQVVLTDDANTFSFTPKSNYGDSIALIVCSGSNTYIKFSMANLGPGITSSNVSKAMLVLYVDAVLTSGTVDVYQVNGSWSEGSITYNNAPTLGAKLFSAVPVTKPGFLSLDVTSSVQAWLAGSLTNNGIALVPSTGSAISASFDSKENIFTSHPADLDLVLVSAGPQGPQGTPGAGGSNGLPGAAATVQVGTVTTGISGSQASVTNVGTANAAVLNFSIPQGASGSGGGGLNGIQEFTQSGTFTVPAGVTRLLVEVWGAGGGGSPAFGPPGGGGGGGGYTRALLFVTPGATYNISVGGGGSRGIDQFNRAGDGGTSQITDSSSNVLVSASGGGAGGDVNTIPVGGPGSGGQGQSGTNVIGRNGGAGGPGGFVVPGLTDPLGGAPPQGSIQPPNGAAAGGAGSSNTDGNQNGGPGYVLITF